MRALVLERPARRRRRHSCRATSRAPYRAPESCCCASTPAASAAPTCSWPRATSPRGACRSFPGIRSWAASRRLGAERRRLGARRTCGRDLARGCRGHCACCREGRENLCELATFTGWDRDGGFAELATVRADVAVRLPADDRRPRRGAAPVRRRHRLPLAPRVSGIQPGGRLGLYGFGASARCRDPGRRALGVPRRTCAPAPRPSGDARSSSAPSGPAATTTRRPSRSTRPSPSRRSGDVVVAALRALDRGGTVAINAIHLDRVPEFPYDLLWWERCLRSVANVTRQDAREFIAARRRRSRCARTSRCIRWPTPTWPCSVWRRERFSGAAVLVP